MTVTPLSSRRPFNLGRPLTVEEIEERLYDMLGMLEDAAVELAVAASDRAKRESDYRRAHAREYLLCDRKTDALRGAHALHVTGELLEARKLAEARETAAAEMCRTRREQAGLLRTVNVNARAAQNGQ